MDTRDRERLMLALPMGAMGILMAALAFDSSVFMLASVMAVTGALNGPIDIALFTLRQRRTDPSWIGRAFAVSMSFNYIGAPVGSALAGAIASRSVEAAIAFGAVASVMSSVCAVFLIPARDRTVSE
jgi:predicted MFS family arabinose efflux permease